LHAPVVGGIVLQAQLFLAAVAKDQLDVLRLKPLNGGDLLGVDAALEDSRRLRLPRELGIGNLVAVGAELAGLVDPKQEVGISPRAAASSCCVRCSHSRKPVKSDGLTISRPSRNCILPFYSKGHSKGRLRQLCVATIRHREGRLPTFSGCEPPSTGLDRGDA